MEYPSKNDIFLKFKAIYDKNDRFVDYILIDSSLDFHKVIKYRIKSIIGKRVSDIVTESRNDILNLKTIYCYMIPKTKRKFEVYNEESNRWYLINIFSDEKDYLFLFYTDISRYKNSEKRPTNRDFNGDKKSTKHCV